jgi:hypothetical protein
VFYQLYEQEVDARIAKKWQVLWVLRRGERLKPLKELVVEEVPQRLAAEEKVASLAPIRRRSL